MNKGQRLTAAEITLTALTAEVAALTARLDALERPAEAQEPEPTSDKLPAGLVVEYPDLTDAQVKAIAESDEPLAALQDLAEPTPNVPRDCTGREWRPEAGWVVRSEVCKSAWICTGDEWVCFVGCEDKLCWVGERRKVGDVVPNLCRILWPLDERTEGKR